MCLMFSSFSELCTSCLCTAWTRIQFLLVASSFVFELDRSICTSWHTEASWRSLVVCFGRHLMVVSSRPHQYHRLRPLRALVIRRLDVVDSSGSYVTNPRIAPRTVDMLCTSTPKLFWSGWIVKGLQCTHLCKLSRSFEQFKLSLKSTCGVRWHSVS